MDDKAEIDYEWTATYSPEDNKLRLYFNGFGRFTDDDKEQIKSAGYKWASKQECYVAPRWTPKAEDMALQMAGEIGDEDYSPLERSADRAERFGGYREKRASEAHDRADTFEAGPSAFGHQNQQRAEKQAARHDKHRVKAVTQWSKAEYWQSRTEGVIAHALYRARPDVRRERIRKLESDLRKYEKEQKAEQEYYDKWVKISEMDGADELIPLDEDGRIIPDQINQAGRLAYDTSNAGHHYGWSFWHPTSEEANEKNREVHTSYPVMFSAYEFLTKEDYIGVPFERFTPKQYADLYLSKVKNPEERSHRWKHHYKMRLQYEKAMLENEGGMAGEAEIEPGGWIRPSKRDISFGRAHVHREGPHAGYAQVLKVNKSSATGRVTSVMVLGDDHLMNDHEICPRKVDVTRLGEDAYQPPTDEERAEFEASQKEKKAKEKISKPKAPSLVNPTNEEAERLQSFLNHLGKTRHDAAYAADPYAAKREFVPSEVWYMTMGQYKLRSKGEYGSCETRTIHQYGGVIARKSSNMWSAHGQEYDSKLGPAVCKLRTGSASGYSWHSPQRIVVITDKPQKPLPLDWDNLGCDKNEVPKEQAELFA